MEESKKDYEVGYKKPPKHSRWRKGDPSPNPAGRPKHAIDVAQIVQSALAREVTIIEGERTRIVTAEAAIELKQINAAMKGDQRAFRAVIDKMARLKLIADLSGRRRAGYLVVREKPTEEEFERRLAALREAYERGDHLHE
jgi:hypothetical protein